MNHFDKRSEMTILGKLGKAWSGVIGNLAHNLATQMATLRMKQNRLRKLMPSLLKGYHLAVKNGLMDDEISEKHLEIMDAMINLDEQITPMFSLLESLSIYCEQSRPDSKKFQRLSAQQCVDELLKTYPLSDEQRHLVQFERDYDFEFMCSPVFIKTLLSHFLTTVLVKIDDAGEGLISIWMSEQDNHHALNIRYSGLGITDDVSSNFFNRFILEQEDKIIPGAGFCRLAIVHAGGDVICDEVKNEPILHLTLKFPKGI
jgi:hypothetical protein